MKDSEAAADQVTARPATGQVTKRQVTEKQATEKPAPACLSASEACEKSDSETAPPATDSTSAMQSASTTGVAATLARTSAAQARQAAQSETLPGKPPSDGKRSAEAEAGAASVAEQSGPSAGQGLPISEPCGIARQSHRPREKHRVTRHNPAATFFVEMDSACCKVALFDAACRDYFRARLFEALARHDAALHSYSLLSERVLLLISAKSRWPLERLLAQTQRAYLAYFNRRFDRQQRSPRSHSALCEIKGVRLVRACHRYIERAPLSSNESNKLGDFSWSSYAANGFGQGSCQAQTNAGKVAQRLQRHCAFANFLPPDRPLAAYRDFLAQPMDPVAERALAARLREQPQLEESAVYLSGLSA